MGNEQLQVEKEAQEYPQSYLDGSSPLTESSEINEEFYRIKAIEEGGLPIEIVSVVPDVLYQRNVAYNSHRGAVKTTQLDELDEITQEYFDVDFESPIFYFATSFLVDFKIYYNTAFGQTYKASFNQNRTRVNARYKYTNTDELIKAILQEVDSSKSINSVGDISSLNTISATLLPDETLTDGKIEINGNKASFSDCKKVETKRTSPQNSDAITRFVVGDNYEKLDSSCQETPREWIWSYVSDVREDGEKIVLTVQTPLGKAVFPYEFNHDTNTPFWNLVDEAGGQLTSLRGMDVCIRRRGGYHQVFDNLDLRSAGFRSHEFPEFDTKNTNQPIETPNKRDEPLLIEEPMNVNPVGVDVKSAWTLGVPDVSRFEDRRQSQSDNSGYVDDSTSENRTVADKITDILSLR